VTAARTAGLRHGRVVAAHGRQYRVECADGDILLCCTRGKHSEAVCGDVVQVRPAGAGQGVIEKIEPRRNLLYRSNAQRAKRIAANVDQVILVVACEPAFSENLLQRGLIAAESAGIAPLIVLNKCDLTDKLPAARARLAPLVRLGYPVLEISARAGGAETLRPHLLGKTSVLVGQSGMGKSTLVNALIPEARAATREISSALDSGKHTTTSARLYHLDAESHLIDSPGLQEFGLGHLDLDALERAFREFAPYLGQCRFRNCRHRQEPGCALQAAMAAGDIDAQRLALFHTLAEEAAKSAAPA
jgi:ribosome biogenesis GTPase